MPVSFRDIPSVIQAQEAAVRRAGEALLDDAKARTPVLTGELRDSAELVYLGPASVRVEYTAPHAHLQHAGDYEHPRGGEKEFLANAATEARSQLGDIIADELRQRLGG